MDHESWAFCEAVKPGQVRAIWWGGRDMLSRILLDCAPYLHHLSWPQCNWQSLPSRCSWAMTADHCSAACSNNSHLLQRFVNLDVRHQLELREYHHRVKMETERVSDYLRRSGERPWAHVHMWPLVCSLLIIKYVSRFYEWVQMVCCHVSDDECYVRQGLTGTRFHLFVSGRLSGYQGQNILPLQIFRTSYDPDPSLTPSDNTCVEHHHLYMLLQLNLRPDI